MTPAPNSTDSLPTGSQGVTTVELHLSAAMMADLRAASAEEGMTIEQIVISYAADAMARRRALAEMRGRLADVDFDKLRSLLDGPDVIGAGLGDARSRLDDLRRRLSHQALQFTASGGLAEAPAASPAAGDRS